MANATLERQPQQPERPPEESVWKRYSPHNEAPLSTVGSLALHALVIGLLVVVGIVMTMLGINERKNKPVEFVTIEQPAPGAPGTPGGAAGQAKAKNPLREKRQAFPEKKHPQVDPRPKLDVNFIAALPVQLQNDPAFQEHIKVGHPNLENFLRIGPPLELPPLAGDPGENPGTGPGGQGGQGGQGGSSEIRINRMLRWTMLFDTTTGQSYVAQLDSLGAILGIPKKPEGGDYWLIRDLKRRPARLLDEDWTKLRRIQWTDSNPKSAYDVATALRLNAVPTHFIAFMPESLELKLAQLEKAYKGLDEKQIFETKFTIVRTGSGFEPRVFSQTQKSP